MGVFEIFELQPTEAKDPTKDSIKIDFTKKSVIMRISFLRFTDNDTKQKVVYSPSLDLSGYGESQEKAFEMVKSSINSFLEWLMHLSKDQIQIELSKLGWKKNKFRSKEFSHVVVDGYGELQDLNAEDNKVERLTAALVA